jgi:CCR4-NOT transcriptional regulation complex NOT5 subunit
MSTTSSDEDGSEVFKYLEQKYGITPPKTIVTVPNRGGGGPTGKYVATFDEFLRDLQMANGSSSGTLADGDHDARDAHDSSTIDVYDSSTIEVQDARDSATIDVQDSADASAHTYNHSVDNNDLETAQYSDSSAPTPMSIDIEYINAPSSKLDIVNMSDNTPEIHDADVGQFKIAISHDDPIDDIASIEDMDHFSIEDST